MLLKRHTEVLKLFEEAFFLLGILFILNILDEVVEMYIAGLSLQKQVRFLKW